MKSLRKSLIISALALLPLAGCDTEGFLSEAGSPAASEGKYGNANLLNAAAMMNEGDARQMLGHRFESEVNNTVTFAFNRSDLSPAAMATLAQQASWIRQFPEVRFSVYGNTDLVGSERYNKGLGLRRAQSVVNYLVSQGISRGRLQALVSYGETRPVVATQGPEERNRRAVTGVSGFTRGHTGLLNGKYAAIIMREYVAGATQIQAGTSAGQLSASSGN
jgi:outer membrane protein OmpA-like peptidoglycan-associated protein